MRRSAATAFTAVAAAPAFVAVSAVAANSVSKPSGTSTGDLILILAGGTGSAPAATGFTDIGSVLDGSSSHRLHMLARMADGSEGSSFFVSNTSAVAAVTYRNVGSATPRDIQTQAVTGGGTTGTYPAVSSQAGDLVVGLFFVRATTAPSTPAGHTERLDSTGGSGSNTLQIVDLLATGTAASANVTVASTFNPRLTVRAAFPPA